MSFELSVIIPAYNSEKFIMKCLLSVVRQKVSAMEIIVVNDGSTDNTAEIVSTLAEQHDMIRLFSTKNQGVAHARNVGLRLARGKYITFVDADDYLEPDAYSSMLYEMKKHNADIVEGACRKEKINGALLYKCMLHEEVIEGKYNCAKHFLEQENCYNYMCNKIYKKELFQNRKFPLLHYSEDYYMNALLHRDAFCKVTLNKIVYHYVIHDQSACGKRIEINRLDTIRAGVMTANLFTDAHLKIYPCVYICDYCIEITRMIYQQKDKALFNEFITDSRQIYLRALKWIAPKKLKNINKSQKYWLYLLFAWFPGLAVRLK